MCNRGPDVRIERVLADPLVQVVMASNGISEGEVGRMLEKARRASDPSRGGSRTVSFAYRGQT